MNIRNQYARILGHKTIERCNGKTANADPIQMVLNIKINPTLSTLGNYN